MPPKQPPPETPGLIKMDVLTWADRFHNAFIFQRAQRNPTHYISLLSGKSGLQF